MVLFLQSCIKCGIIQSDILYYLAYEIGIEKQSSSKTKPLCCLYSSKFLELSKFQSKLYSQTFLYTMPEMDFFSEGKLGKQF